MLGAMLRTINFEIFVTKTLFLISVKIVPYPLFNNDKQCCVLMFTTQNWAVVNIF